MGIRLFQFLCVADEGVRHSDRNRKIKMKEYADRTRNAEKSGLVAGDKVLLK